MKKRNSKSSMNEMEEREGGKEGSERYNNKREMRKGMKRREKDQSWNLNFEKY